MSDDKIQPSQQRGGAAPGADESRAKGEWAAKAGEGVVPPDLGGSDAPPDALADDPQLGSDVLGSSTASDEPATEAGIDPAGGDHADATSHGGPKRAPGVEPDLRDAASGPRAVDH